MIFLCYGGYKRKVEKQSARVLGRISSVVEERVVTVVGWFVKSPRRARFNSGSTPSGGENTEIKQIEALVYSRSRLHFFRLGVPAHINRMHTW